MNYETDDFWFNDKNIIFREDRITEFFPVTSMTYNEKLNALLRLSIYASILLFIYYKNHSFFLIPISTALITLYIYRFNTLTGPKSETYIDKKQESCRMPTEDNPFSNTLVSDYNNGKIEPACKITDEVVAESAEEKFNRGLFKDINDLYDKNNSQRQFFTMPSTTEFGNVGDTVALAKWLYGNPNGTCKEDTTQCTNSFGFYHNDLRNKPQLLLNETI
jgi:hypothetical protein